MDTYKYLIIGGGMAGGRAAENIRKLDAGASLALVAAEPHAPYDRTHLSKDYLLGTAGLEKLYLKEESFYAQNGITLLRGAPVVKLEPAARRVTLADGRQLGYEKLLLATGGRALRLPIPGADLAGVFTLRTIEDADAIRQWARPGAPAVVIGGSFIGAEAAAVLAQLGLRVSIVFPGARLLERVIPEDLGAWLRARYDAHGVQIIAGARPARLEGAMAVERVVLADGRTLPAGLVVIGVGIELQTQLARAAGLALTEQGAIIVDEYLRSSTPDIYAAGDIAAWPDPLYGKRLRVEHWDVARRQGIRAGRNMAGEAKPYTDLPYFYSDIFDLSFDAWGDLSAWDATVLRGEPAAGAFALYYFFQGRMAGALAVGLPEEERKRIQALVKARPAYADVERETVLLPRE